MGIKKVIGTLGAITLMTVASIKSYTLGSSWVEQSTTQLYHVNTEQDHNALNNVLECRNGRIVIEVVQGTVLDNNGNGIDNCGYYIKYDSKQFTEGDKVETVLVYNPDTNFVDDILYRVDTKIE